MIKKKDLIDLIAEETELKKKDVETMLNVFIQKTTDALGNGEEVQIAGFGTFKISERAARMGTNLQTGEPMEIAASKSVRFKPLKALKDAVNR